MKYSLCLEPLFPQIPFDQRILIAKEIGYDAIEFWDPTVHEINNIKKVTNNCGIPIAAMALIDNWGVRISDNIDLVRTQVEESLKIGQSLGCSCFIGLSGDLRSKIDTEKNILIDNLKRLADLFMRYNAMLVLEPLNSFIDHKGYYLDSSALGFEIIRCVDHPCIRLLFDIYHMQIMEGNIIENILRNIEYIGHFHAAGVPGRTEPQKGELNYVNITQVIKNTGYRGYFGLEYWATFDDTKSAKETLKYLKGEHIA